MYWKTTIAAGSIAIVLGAFSATPMVGSALAACSPSDPINATTSNDAMKAMESAGYTQVHVYAKGCDNSWHAHATLNGQPVNVVWNGEGQVLTEGD
jgi:hypothetical protein